MLKKIFFALTRTEKFVFVGALLVCMVGSAVLVRIFVDEATATVPGFGGSYTEGMVGQPSLLNPVTAASDIDRALVRLVFSSVADIAETIESEEGGKSWRVRLKEDIYWHDGERLTTDDVIFTVQKIQDETSRSPLAPVWAGVVPRRVSELEIRFNLGAPYPLFPAALSNLYVLPRHIFENIPPPNWHISEYGLEPVGSGPYRFGSHQIKSDGFIAGYSLVANDSYFGEPPYLKEVSLRFFPNEEELLAAFNAGRIDAFAGIAAHEFANLRRPYDVHAFTLSTSYAIFMNQSQNIALKEKAVREALSKAIDRKKLVASALNGHGEVLTSPLPFVTHTPDGSASSTLEIASAILENAGWEKGEDGIWEKHIKNSEIFLELELTMPEVPFLARAADAVREAWSALGARVEIRTVPLSETRENIIKNRDYEMLLFGNTLGSDNDLTPFWHSSERFHPGLNLSIYESTAVDRLLEAARVSEDPAERASKLAEISERIAEDYPAIFLFSPHYLLVTGKNIYGIEAGPLKDPSERFARMPLWHTKLRRVVN